MGVNGLSQFVKNKIPAAVERTTAKKFTGKKLAIDVSVMGHRFIHRAYPLAIKEDLNLLPYRDPTSPPDWVDYDRLWSLWFGLFMTFVEEVISCGITPVFIFDGKAPETKKGTKEAREASKHKVRTELDMCRSEWDSTPVLDRSSTQGKALRKALEKNTVMPPNAFDNLRKALINRGIPAMRAIGEADALCAALSIEGVVEGVISNDSDLLLYGVKTVIFEWSSTFSMDAETGKYYTHVSLYNLDTVLSQLLIDQRQLVDMGLLCGTDHNKGVHRIGPAKGHAMVYHNYTYPPEVEAEFALIRPIFAYVNSKELIDGGEYYSLDVDKLKEEGGSIVKWLDNFLV